MDFRKLKNTAIYILKKNSPSILLAGGLIGTTTGVVMACKATTKLEPILIEHEESIESIHAAVESGWNATDEYTEKDEKKDLTKTYCKTGLKLAKLYAPSVLTIGTSYGMIFGGHRILSKRNIALGAAYATLDSMFNQYRANIIDKYGEEIDKEARFNIKAKKIKNKDGTKETKYETTDNTYTHLISDYARFFDEMNPYWNDCAEYNLLFLKKVEQFCNEQLIKNGILYLNEVYKALGFKITKAGQVVGWRYKPNDPTRDNYVSFGIYDVNDPAKRDFVNGYEKSILLDFNCDGNIWSDMAEDIDNPKSTGNWVRDFFEFGGKRAELNE
jgi:hypothetical protein